MLRTISMTLVVLTSLLVNPLSAQDWAEKMFTTLEHDFGTVARGAETVYRFEIRNLYKQTMHITGVRSSCGCTTPTIENATIKTHEKAYIVAKFNTHTHIGRKSATLTISLGAPFAAQVQVRVHGNIRSDVVFHPGLVQFGNVDEGEPSVKRVTVNFAGRNSWQIVDVRNDNDRFEVELNETQRSRARVTYELLVRLKGDQPPGFITDQLSIITNDPRADSQRIPLFVGGRVIPEISVTPQTLALGALQPGEVVTRKVVVRGKKPFRIQTVDCGDDCLSFKTDGESRAIHFVEVSYVADENLGAVRLPVEIKTDRANGRGATLQVSATVVEPASTPLPAEQQSSGQSANTAETALAEETASN